MFGMLMEELSMICLRLLEKKEACMEQHGGALKH